jgi:hypothetical protein
MVAAGFIWGSKFSNRHSTVRLNCVRLLVLVGFSCLHAPGAGRVYWQLLESMEWLMTDDDQKDLRRASAQSFFESLDELFDSIESNSTQAAQPKSPPPPAKSASQSSSLPKKTRPAKINLSDFEDAIADLEQFIQSKHQKRPESNQ